MDHFYLISGQTYGYMAHEPERNLSGEKENVCNFFWDFFFFLFLETSVSDGTHILDRGEN